MMQESNIFTTGPEEQQKALSKSFISEFILSKQNLGSQLGTSVIYYPDSKRKGSSMGTAPLLCDHIPVNIT